MLFIVQFVHDNVMTCGVNQNFILICQEKSWFDAGVDSKEVSKQYISQNIATTYLADTDIPCIPSELNAIFNCF